MKIEILTTLLWPATAFVTLAVILNYFVIKSDLKNIKKLISKVINMLTLITLSFMFTLVITSSFKETAEVLKLDQALLFVIFSVQLILSIIISLKITPFLTIWINDKERVEAEENAFWCLFIFLILSAFIFIKYYSL